VTDAIQLKFSARTLNRKLGVLKDPSNINVVQASFNNLTERLNTDSIKVCACDFIDGLNYDSVVSVGVLKTCMPILKIAWVIILVTRVVSCRFL